VQQNWLGVEVCRWVPDFPQVEPAEVVIEAFGCALPPSYVAAMAARQLKPAWINLEYLSAESWVLGCHGLPSPHPQLPLVKHFFFPGFAPQAGGLLLEEGLFERRDAFQRSPRDIAAFWASLGEEAPLAQAVKISLFCYPNPALAGLLGAWAASPAPVVCFVPEGTPAAAVAGALGKVRLLPNARLHKASLTIRVLPFLEQDAYDRLLWACDCNFVRGEDSFVRAQWAAKPLVWHIYPQEENAHEVKLSAFLDLYCAQLPAVEANALRDFWSKWTRGGMGELDWGDFWQHRRALEQHALRWSETLRTNGDLAANLVYFCNNMI
jgi:uncharacterized repeat protein (TIGR03837 family)